jgi:hypothetical protein
VPTVSIELSDEVAAALARKARALLLSRNQFIRALLAAVSTQAERERAFAGRGQQPKKPACALRNLRAREGTGTNTRRSPRDGGQERNSTNAQSAKL